MRLVLDAEAVSVLIQRGSTGRRTVQQAMEAARRLRREVALATVTLAELYRGPGRSQALDSLLAREQEEIFLRDTDRQLARLVGSILAEASLSSEQMADAHVVAVAVEDGGGVVLTGDEEDLKRLAAPYRTVVIEKI
jgi:predicted nucleic acid-binding protein